MSLSRCVFTLNARDVWLRLLRSLEEWRMEDSERTFDVLQSGDGVRCCCFFLFFVFSFFPAEERRYSCHGVVMESYIATSTEAVRLCLPCMELSWTSTLQQVRRPFHCAYMIASLHKSASSLHEVAVRLRVIYDTKSTIYTSLT